MQECDHRSSPIYLALEEDFRKIINRGIHIASVFELIFNPSTRISDEQTTLDRSIPSLKNASEVTLQPIDAILCSNTRDPFSPNIRDTVFFWRDREGRFRPVTVKRTDNHTEQYQPMVEESNQA